MDKNQIQQNGTNKNLEIRSTDQQGSSKNCKFGSWRKRKKGYGVWTFTEDFRLKLKRSKNFSLLV